MSAIFDIGLFFGSVCISVGPLGEHSSELSAISHIVRSFERVFISFGRLDADSSKMLAIGCGM